jgi:hypothetical protein
MDRTAIDTQRLVVVRYDYDGKEIDRYHLHNNGSAHFADVANTLDHARQTGLEPFVDDAKKPVLAKAK